MTRRCSRAATRARPANWRATTSTRTGCSATTCSILFPLIIVGYALPILQIAVLVLFIALLVEWYLTGRRIVGMARERYGKAEGGPMTIGFYAGSRAYLPRRWRLPAPQVERGADI